MSTPLILASGSATRLALLHNAGLAVEAVPAAIDEAMVKESLRADGASAADVAQELAHLKAERVSRRLPGVMVLGADQMLDCGGTWFDKPATMRVEYHSGRKIINEWICFDHPEGSFPRRRANGWWIESGGNLPSPDTVADALDRTRELRTVVAVKTRDENGYDRVIARRFARRDERAFE